MSTEHTMAPEHIIPSEGETKTIYADRIFGFGIGPGVTKLNLGLEGSKPNSIIPTINLVLPTHSLIESLQFIMKAIKENEELREGFFKQVDAFRENIKSGL